MNCQRAIMCYIIISLFSGCAMSPLETVKRDGGQQKAVSKECPSKPMENIKEPAANDEKPVDKLQEHKIVVDTPAQPSADNGESLQNDEIWIIVKNKTSAQAKITAPGIYTNIDNRSVSLPLSTMQVNVDIVAFSALVKVMQEFTNPYTRNLDIEYRLPMPKNSTLTDFIMTIGKRSIRGIICERERATRLYQFAQKQGYKATLLLQKQNNILLQKIANIPGGKKIVTQIKYFHRLQQQDGEYEFLFPAKIKPEFSYVNLSCGCNLAKIYSPTHSLTIKRFGQKSAKIAIGHSLSHKFSAFVLRYGIQREIGHSYIWTYRDKFALLIHAPLKQDIKNLHIASSNLQPLMPIPKIVAGGKCTLIFGTFKKQGTIKILANNHNKIISLELHKGQHPIIEKLWAYYKIKSLQHNNLYDSEKRRQMVDTSIAYNVLCPYTSFVLVDTLK